jgi:hypothetical protein
MGFRSQDAWRKHPHLTDLWKDPFPGLKKAVIAFTFYYATEKMFPSVYQAGADLIFGEEEVHHHHHDHAEGEGH